VSVTLITGAGTGIGNPTARALGVVGAGHAPSTGACSAHGRNAGHTGELFEAARHAAPLPR
jgi:NAD(P)-dependent dehydrogenase (short-subunit alcohol dehydrogenase family)